MSKYRTPVEVETCYSTTTEDLAQAWSFVMECLDVVGPDPEITIKPFWSKSVHDTSLSDDEEWPRNFGVIVKGTTEKEE